MPIELAPLVRTLSLTETEIAGVPMHRGSIEGREVVAIVTGMGTELATAGTRRLLDAVPVRWVLVVGITGALENETPIGTLVLPEVVVNSESGREFRPWPLADGTPAGKMWTTNGLTTQSGDLAPAARRGCRVARHGDGGDRRALRRARHPLVGVPGDLRSRERRNGRRRGVPPQQSGRHPRTPPRSSATSRSTPSACRCSRKMAARREARHAHRGRRRDRSLREDPLMRLAVIGAGMAGILSAIKLDEAGLTDFTVYEKGDRLGGTWRENTYPGSGLRRSLPPLLVLVRARPPTGVTASRPGRRSGPTSSESRARHDVVRARALRRRGHRLRVRRTAAGSSRPRAATTTRSTS